MKNPDFAKANVSNEAINVGERNYDLMEFYLSLFTDIELIQTAIWITLEPATTGTILSASRKMHGNPDLAERTLLA
jgi:hypothetical protein